MADDFDAFLASGALLEVAKHKRAADEAKRQNAALLKELELAQERLGVALSIRAQKDFPKIEARRPAGKKSEATAVILASDWHVEETVDPRTVNGKNEYNPGIAEKRARAFFQNSARLIEHARAGTTVDDVILWLGGDMISGYIHEELAETNAMSPTEAILFCQGLLVAGINMLLKEVGPRRLIVACSFGNHGRTTLQRRISSGAQNSFEWLMYQSIRAHYTGNPKLEVVVADGAHLYLKVYANTVRFTHGDDIRYGGGVGGLGIPLRKACDSWDHFRKADLTCIGHWHQFLDHGFCVSNGSLIGFNAYALSVKARFEPPRQAFFLLDRDRGKSLVAPIWVE